MTADGWIVHAALGELLADGALVLVRDPMELPLVALRRRCRIATPEPVRHLQPVEGGHVVRRLGPMVPGADAALPGIAVGDEGTTEVQAFAHAFGRPPDMVVAGGGVSFPRRFCPAKSSRDDLSPGHRGALPERLAEAVALAEADPVGALRRAAGQVPGIRGLGVTETADVVLWLDPVCCLRGLSREAAREVALESRVALSRWRPLRLRLPLLGAGRLRLEFEGARSDVEIAGAPGQIVEVAPGTFDVVAGAGAGPILDLIVRGHRAHVVRAGAVVPVPVEAAEAGFGDPLDEFADPLAFPATGSPA